MKKTRDKSTKTETATKTDSGIQVLSKLTKDLFDLIGLKSIPEVSEDKENDAYLVTVSGDEETGLLIGSRGRTLSSLQSLLGLMYRQKTEGEWKRIVVNVSDYREKEEERLRQLAHQTAERAKTTGDSQQLYNLNASQRRIVHMTLAEDSDIVTESQGEGADRYLVVSPKK